jgi:hypothetical protein
MKRFYIVYRGEFSIEVDAGNKEEALEIAENATRGWEAINNLYPEYLEIEDEEEIEND